MLSDDKLMTLKHKEFLSRNSAKFIASLNANSVITKLGQRNVLSQADLESLSECSPENKTKYLLKILERKPDRACGEFMKALSETKQDHLVEVVCGRRLNLTFLLPS